MIFWLCCGLHRRVIRSQGWLKKKKEKSITMPKMEIRPIANALPEAERPAWARETQGKTRPWSQEMAPASGSWVVAKGFHAARTPQTTVNTKPFPLEFVASFAYSFVLWYSLWFEAIWVVTNLPSDFGKRRPAETIESLTQLKFLFWVDELQRTSV